MEPQSGVLLVTAEPETAQAVDKTLRASGRLALAGTCRALDELAARLQADRVSAAIVDIDPHPGRMLAELEPIIARFSGTRFVLLASGLDKDLILEAMQIGARHCLQKGAVRSELAGVLQRLTANGSARPPGRGSVIGVLSAGGGCGATTLAVNLANELCQGGPEAALVVDLDSSFGAVATCLGVKGDYGVADILAHSGNADPQLVSSSATVCSDHLHVLLSPASVDYAAPAPLQYDNLGAALEACKQAYPYTVVDAPRVPIEVAAVLAKACSAALIVMQLTIKDIHVARRLRGALLDRGVAAGRIVPVINRHRKRKQMIGLDECRRALDVSEIELIGNDYRNAIRGINFGQPLAEAAPMSSIRKDIRRLARTLALQGASLSQR
jgi:pilus assembly protein CpaE